MSPTAVNAALFSKIPPSALPQLSLNVGLAICPDTPRPFTEFGLEAGWTAVKSRAVRRSAIARLGVQFDAIVGMATPSVVDFFQTMLSLAKLPQRPVLILVTGSLTEFWSHADFCCSPEPHHVLQTLRSAGMLRASCIESTEQIADQQIKLDALQAREHEIEQLGHELMIFQQAIARNVAHEMRTPMLQVKAAIAGLVDQFPTSSNLVDFAVQSTSRLESVVQDITMLADGMDIRIQPIIAQDVVEVALRDRRRRWNNVPDDDRIQIEMESNRLVIEGDYKGLSFVMQHLIDNALKFSAKEHPVDVIVRRHGQAVWYCVQDRGIGISRKHRDRIFDPFYQVDSGHTRMRGGTGLGLTLVKMILDKHGAELVIESQKGMGSKFSFVLPILEL